MSFHRSLRVEETAKRVCTFVFWILLTAITRGDEPPKNPTTDTATTPSSASVPTTADASTQSSTSWYQLVNVTIPPDSPLRNDDNTNKPPELYIVLKRNGREIDVKCTVHKGWSVDFAQVPDGSVNVWPIRQGTNDRFTVEVWDSQVWGYHQVFNVTGLSGKDFDSTIREPGGALITKDRLATIVFQKVAVPAKYATNKK